MKKGVNHYRNKSKSAWFASTSEAREQETKESSNHRRQMRFSSNTRLADVLQSTLSQLTSLEPYISNQIVLVLTCWCCNPVAQVKQVTSQIRAMSNFPTVLCLSWIAIPQYGALSVSFRN